jgi:hypothetical protein
MSALQRRMRYVPGMNVRALNQACMHAYDLRRGLWDTRVLDSGISHTTLLGAWC